MTNRHRNYAGVEQYGETSQFREENEYQNSVTIVGSDSASDILFFASQKFCSMVFNISVAGCVASNLNLCLRHVAVPNSLVSLHKAVQGVQDGQSDIDFSSFWSSFPNEVPWRQVIFDAGTNLWESTIFPEET